MPTYEALERYFIRSFEEESDETFKNAGLPRRQAVRHWQQAQAGTANSGNILARILLPALGNVDVVAGRCDRQIAMLRIVRRTDAPAGKGIVSRDLDSDEALRYAGSRPGRRLSISSMALWRRLFRPTRRRARRRGMT